MNYIAIKSLIIRTAGLGISMVTLSGCDWIGIFAKEAVIGATSHRGWDTFTFTGQLPANFGLDAIAYYGPDNPSAVNCQVPTFKLGETVTRGHIKEYTANTQGQPQAFSFEMPLSYYKGLCGMKLGRVRLQITGRYGDKKWQQSYSGGALYFVRDTTLGASRFEGDKIFELASSCYWSFKESVSRSSYGEIEKNLRCGGAGADILRGELAGKIVNLKIELELEEAPSKDKTWIKFSNGWKPCAVKNGWRWCREPIEFQTFKMNGQTCTVYPNCTE